MEVETADEGRDGDGALKPDRPSVTGEAETPELLSKVEGTSIAENDDDSSLSVKETKYPSDICQRDDVAIKDVGGCAGEENVIKGPSTVTDNVSGRSGCDNNGRSSDVGLEFLDPNDSGVNGKRRRHRRKQKGGKHHRKWKPYDKLTWDERKTLEERECRRACKKRENRFASGQAMAPYNTTQFLMEQHEPEESELHLDESRPNHHHHSIHGTELCTVGSGGSGEGSSDEYDDSNEEEIFLEKDFTEAYEQYQAERLQSMTKGDLVKEYLGLETEVEDLKRQLKDLENVNRRNSSGSGSNSALQSPDLPDRAHKPINELQLEIEKLRAENRKLAKENDRLKCEGDPSIRLETSCEMELNL